MKLTPVLAAAILAAMAVYATPVPREHFEPTEADRNDLIDISASHVGSNVTTRDVVQHITEQQSSDLVKRYFIPDRVPTTFASKSGSMLAVPFKKAGGYIAYSVGALRDGSALKAMRSRGWIPKRTSTKLDSTHRIGKDGKNRYVKDTDGGFVRYLAPGEHAFRQRFLHLFSRFAKSRRGRSSSRASMYDPYARKWFELDYDGQAIR